MDLDARIEYRQNSNLQELSAGAAKHKFFILSDLAACIEKLIISVLSDYQAGRIVKH